MNNLNDFDYEIPQNLIAQKPLAERDQSRLMLLNRKNGKIEDKHFFQITDYLREDDLLVFNDTKVLPARLFGHKKTGGLVEVLLLNKTESFQWNVLVKTGSKPKPQDKIKFDNSIFGTILDKVQNGSCKMMFSKDNENFKSQQEFMQTLELIGRPPLPPYIKREKIIDSRDLKDKDQYQTVYAKKAGAIAAPTAGLHFTKNLLNKIEEIGIETTFVTLHVGLGTFKPIKDNDYQKHDMHSEYFEISETASQIINKAKNEKRRVICVGTTSCRVLETAGKDGKIKPCSGWTNLFIYPPHKFNITDALITNFHQAKTTLLLLVSAFAGSENIRNAYQTAINNGYRFYSYGDSMFIT